MGQTPHRADIANITNDFPCVITTVDAHGYSTRDFVRLTNLNGAMPIPRGMDELNNYRFRIVVTGTTTFKLQDPITHVYINSTTYPPYVTGGYCNLIEHDFVYHDDDEEE